MKKVKLPVFYHTDSTEQMKAMAIDYSYSECRHQEVTFYNIVAVTENLSEGDHTDIFANGTLFTSPLPYAEVLTRIEEAQKLG